ncbi:hemolysin XhlA family protein [Bacillus cereus group sp. Bc011]|uniref:hemolysin XhlA family protein n=1 Tax=unclassified Bacillus cereus group TaxID=2750818 RepID=UPI0022DFE9BF|nr:MULTISPECIES: hemolysin XhlA family protein [unclassified Bacillus cereus group]MDA2681079.1 hemolysin XhlA family protein [Bacillus cereus group sp. Bc029]MDA2742023.1 hemolysin XhlA family protein [Bacillus cereus group sp. Bc011]
MPKGGNSCGNFLYNFRQFSDMMKWKIMQWGGGHVMHTEDYVPTKLGEHETRLTSLEVRMAVAESGLKDTKESLQKIADNTTWTLRIVIGAAVTGVIGAIISFVMNAILK